MENDILSEIEGHAESAKLVQVRQLIDAILRQHDVCADIVLCGRGRYEVFTHLQASWSVIRLEKDGDSHLLVVKNDMTSSLEARNLAARASASMARALMLIHLEHSQEWAQASAWIDEKVGAMHTPLMEVKDQGPMQ